MKPLTGIDATFLYMETPETPMHVAGLTLYQPPARSRRLVLRSLQGLLPRAHPSGADLREEAGAARAGARPSRLGRRRGPRFRLPSEARHPATAGRFQAVGRAGRAVAFRAARPFAAALAIHHRRRPRRRQCRDLCQDASCGGRWRRWHGDRRRALRHGAGAAEGKTAAAEGAGAQADHRRARHPRHQRRHPEHGAPAHQGAGSGAADSRHADRPACPAQARRERRFGWLGHGAGHSRRARHAGAKDAVQRHHHQPALLRRARGVADRREIHRQGDRHEDQRRGDGGLRRRAAALSSGAGRSCRRSR